MALRLIHGPLENVNHCAASKASNPNTKKLRIRYTDSIHILIYLKLQIETNFKMAQAEKIRVIK